MHCCAPWLYASHVLSCVLLTPANLHATTPALSRLTQFWFNLCIKAFVILFCYINFLPIPWRVSIAVHVFGTLRDCGTGLDFYGRPTKALWFWIATATRRWLAVLLNLAWVFHFVCLAMHFVWPTYIEGQTWPGVFAQNLPFVLSIACQVAAGIIQGRAEKQLLADYPDKFPPRLTTMMKGAYRRWKADRTKGPLVAVLWREFSGVHAATALTGIEDAPAKPLSPPRHSGSRQDAAATKIQAVQRGRSARKAVRVKLQAMHSLSPRGSYFMPPKCAAPRASAAAVRPKSPDEGESTSSADTAELRALQPAKLAAIPPLPQLPRSPCFVDPPPPRSPSSADSPPSSFTEFPDRSGDVARRKAPDVNGSSPPSPSEVTQVVTLTPLFGASVRSDE